MHFTKCNSIISSQNNTARKVIFIYGARFSLFEIVMYVLNQGAAFSEKQPHYVLKDLFFQVDDCTNFCTMYVFLTLNQTKLMKTHFSFHVLNIHKDLTLFKRSFFFFKYYCIHNFENQPDEGPSINYVSILGEEYIFLGHLIKP